MNPEGQGGASAPTVNRAALEQNANPADSNLSPEEQAALQKVAETSPEATKYRKLKPKQFYRSQFVIGPVHPGQAESTRFGILRNRGERARLQGSPTEEETIVDFEGTDVYQIFNAYATDRINNLAGLAKRDNGTYLQSLLDSHLGSSGDREFIQACADTVIDENGRIVSIKINKEKLDRYLSSVEGYEHIAADMEKTAILTELGLNMQAATLPEAERRALYDRMRALFGPPSLAGRIADAFYTLNWQVPENIWRALHSTGVDFEKINASHYIVAQLQNNLSEADQNYLFSIYGINIRALVPLGTPRRGVVQDQLKPEQYFDPATQRREVYTTNVLNQKLALERAAEAMRGRKLFLEKLGIEDVGGSAEEFIFRGRQHLGRIPTLYNQRLLQEYEQEAGIESRRLNAPLSDFQRAYIFNRVRMRIMHETAETYLSDVMYKENTERDSAQIAEKRRRREKDSSERTALVDKRTKSGEEVAEKAREEKERIKTAKKENLQPLEDANAAVADKEQEFLNQYRDILTSGDIYQDFQTEITRLENNQLATKRRELATLKRLRRVVRPTATTLINTRITEWSNAISNLQQAQIQGGKNNPFNIPAPPVEIISTQADKQEALYDRDIVAVEAEVKRIEDQIKVLQDKQKEYTDALAKRTNEARRLAIKDSAALTEPDRRLKELLGLQYSPKGGQNTGNIISRQEIQALSVEQIMQRMDLAQGSYTDEQKRTIIVNAKAELRGEEYEAAHPPTAEESDALDLITGLQIQRSATNPNAGTYQLSAQDILSRSPVELARILSTVALPPNRKWATGNVMQDILAAQRLASQRLMSRYAARLEIEEHYWDAREKAADPKEAKKRVEEAIDREDIQLEIAQILRDDTKREAILNRAHAILDPRNAGRGNLQERLSNTSIIQADNTRYTESERNKPAGYIAWMQLLYPEYEGAFDENERFEALSTMINPDELAEIIDTSLSLQAPRPQQNNANVNTYLVDVLNALHNRLPQPPARTTLTRDQFHQAFLRMMSLVQQKARAI